MRPRRDAAPARRHKQERHGGRPPEYLPHSLRGGWNGIKLYFMLGLPTETDEDVLGIAELANKVLHTWREYSPHKQRGVRITVSTSCFIPKPHSPFQWEPQVTMDEYRRRVNLLRENIKARNVQYNWHDADTSFIEAVLSRGDRRVGDVLEAVWRRGARMEAWSDYFDFKRWLAAFADCGPRPCLLRLAREGRGRVPPLEPSEHGREDLSAAPRAAQGLRGPAQPGLPRPVLRLRRRRTAAQGGEVRWISSVCVSKRPARPRT